MKFVIAGGSGSIGFNFIQHIQDQHDIVILTRQKSKKISNRVKQCHYNSNNIDQWSKELLDCDVLINLVGESIAGIRWSKKKKDEILKSRLNSINDLSKALDYINHYPNFIINAFTLISVAKNTFSIDSINDK